ncbi:MAG: hypothetical protein MRY72_14205 [Aquisalinus sp.]|nr:hypothetical protein [Aquisalinus sp.]
MAVSVIIGLSIVMVTGTAAAESPIVTATNNYKTAIEKMGALGVNDLAANYRAEMRQSFLEEDLRALYMQARYPGTLVTATPGAAEFLCAPQYQYRALKDTSASIALVGTTVGNLSEPNGATGINLFVYELLTERSGLSENGETTTIDLTPQQLETLNASIRFEPMALSGRLATSNTSGRVGLCPEMLSRREVSDELNDSRTKEHQDVCACGVAITRSQDFYFPLVAGNSQNESLGGVVAVATFLKDIFPVFNKVLGIAGDRMRERDVRRAVFSYLSDVEVKARFDRATEHLQGELHKNYRAELTEAGRSYWQSYCTYADLRQNLLGLLGEDIDPVSSARPPANSRNVCDHIRYQAGFGQKSDQSSDEDTSREARILSVYSELKTSAEKLVESASAYDEFLAREDGDIMNGIRNQYEKLRDAADPSKRTSAEKWMNLINQTQWLAETIVTIDIESAKYNQALETAEDYFAEDKSTE